MTTKKIDHRTLRFSKASVRGHIETLMKRYEKEFEAAEKRPLNKTTGTSQCFNDKSLAAYTAWSALEELLEDVNWWGVKGW